MEATSCRRTQAPRAVHTPLLPALLGMLFELANPYGKAGQMLGIVLAVCALSFLVVRPLVMAYCKNQPPRGTMRTMMILGFIVAAPLLVLALIR